MKPPMPETIKIGPHVYKVILDKNTKQDDKGTGELMGRICYAINTIHVGECAIMGKVALSKLHTHLLHEVLHGIDNFLGDIIFKGKNEEDKVEAMTSALYMVIQDNPKLVDFLKKGE